MTIPRRHGAGDAARLWLRDEGSTPRLWGAVGDHGPGGSPVAQRAAGAGALTLASLGQLVVGGKRLKLAGVLIRIHRGPLSGNRCQRHAGRPSMSGPALCLCREKSRWPDAGRRGGPNTRRPVEVEPIQCSAGQRCVSLSDQPPRLFHQSRGPMFHGKPVSFHRCAFHVPTIGRNARNGEEAGGQ
jgi:hypothetical protein